MAAMYSDKDENLHQLLGLVLDVGRFVLEKTFAKKYEFCELDTYLKCNERKIESLKKKGIIQSKHMDILFPQKEDRQKLKNMDITLLYILLRYLCNMEKPKNGWDSVPSESDTTPAADILRLKNMRHDLFFYRHKKEFTKEVFFCNWKVTFDAILRLGKDFSEKDSSDIMKQVTHIVAKAVHEESSERDFRLCKMLHNGFKDDINEKLIYLQKRLSTDHTFRYKLKALEEKLNDLHIKPDDLFKIEEELCSLKVDCDGQSIEQESILETPKKSPAAKELPNIQRGSMDKVHSDCIQRNIVQLKEELDCTDILDNLIQERILADDDVEKIQAEPTKKGKNNEFLVILLNRGPRAFPGLLNALRLKGYLKLVNQLEESLEQINRNLQDRQVVVYKEYQECKPQIHEDIETSSQMTMSGDVQMKTCKPVTCTDDSVLMLEIGGKPLEHCRTGVRISDSVHLEVAYSARKPNNLCLEDPVKHGMTEIQDTSVKKVIDVVADTNNTMGKDSVISLPQESENTQEIRRVSQMNTTPFSDIQIEKVWTVSPVQDGVSCLQRNSDPDKTRDQYLHKIETQALPPVNRSGPENYQEQTPFASIASNQQVTRKNKNIQPCKMKRNKNIQSGKLIKDQKLESCQQFPTLKLRLPTEHQRVQTSQLERKYRDLNEWVQLAQKKIDEGTSENVNVEDFQTIICLDASHSMRENGWAEATKFIEDFITGMEAVRVDHGIFECVALTVFGAKTDVIQSLTMDLGAICKQLRSFIPDGPTQLYGGLYMALAAQAGYLPITTNGVKHCPQVVLITDGKATHPKLVAGPDTQEEKDLQETHANIMKVVQEIAAKDICINCIPVGNADVPFLEKIASKAKGKLYTQNSGQLLAQRTYNMLNAANLLQYWNEVNIGHQSADGRDPISMEDVINNKFPDLCKESGLKSFPKLTESQQASVLATAKDLIEFKFWQGTGSLPSNFLQPEREGDDSGRRLKESSSSQDIRGDLTTAQQNVGGIQKDQFEKGYLHEPIPMEDGSFIQKDLDLQSKEKYEHKGFWAQYAAMEHEKARSSGSGFINTVLCIDTSASMRGWEWIQVETFVKEFLSGLEDMRLVQQMVYDNVAIVVFGSRTQVLVGLTDNCSNLRQEFGKIKLGGPSPLFGGLMLALACQGDSMERKISGIVIHPRIVLITDGKPTVTEKVAGHDIFVPDSFSEINNEVRVLMESFRSVDIKVHCIPVGDADERILKTITEVTGGKLLSFKDGRRLARRTLYAQKAGSIADQWKVQCTAAMLKGEELTLEDFLDGSTYILGSVPPEDKEGIRDILEEFETNEPRKLTPDEIMHTEVIGPDLLPLGTRVQSEPIWCSEEEGSKGYGTVVGHIPHQKEIYVEWDTSGKVTKCRYGSTMHYDVSQVEFPRILNVDQIIAVGCVVTRGSDWMYGDQDGFPGAKGVVIKVNDDGRVLVRWNSGGKGFYRYSQDDKYDLLLI